jgi:hypothetical protein
MMSEMVDVLALVLKFSVSQKVNGESSIANENVEGQKKATPI